MMNTSPYDTNLNIILPKVAQDADAASWACLWQHPVLSHNFIGDRSTDGTCSEVMCSGVQGPHLFRLQELNVSWYGAVG